MKTIKLLLISSLFLSVAFTTASAETMKCGAEKCGSSMKTPKVKEESKSWSPRKFGDVKMNAEDYDDKSWKIKEPKEEYQRGSISTH